LNTLYMEKSIYECMQTRLYQGSIRPKIQIALQCMVKICNVEFKEYQSNGLLDKRESPVMVICKPDFIMDEYG
jgi:hypothetical protein